MSSSRRRDRPHDLVFRFTFSRVEHARGVLRQLVGEETAARLDWQTLRPEPGTYVEEALRDSLSDLLFSACFHGSERRALGYLLWDHQSRPDRMMPLRLHNYGGRSLHDYTKRADAIPGYVPTLIPILVYQGPGEWPGPHLLSELSVLPDEPPPPVYVDLRMIVHALDEGSLPSSELTTLARTTLRLLRMAALGQLVIANAERIARWLDRVHRVHGYDDYRALMEYVERAGSEDGMIEAVIEYGDELGEPLSAREAKIWKQAREEARDCAREEAEIEAKAKLVLLMIEHRFGPLPEPLRAKVLDAAPRRLEKWALRLLSAATLAEVLDVP